MPRQSCRPLKCTFCCRRFKYDACMNDHIRTDHYPVLLQLLQHHATHEEEIQRSHHSVNTPQPIRVSVIKENIFSE